MDKPRPLAPDKPLAWCLPEIRATYALLYPALHWEAMPGDITSASSLIVTELENRRSTNTLTPVPFEDLPMLARGGWIRQIAATCEYSPVWPDIRSWSAISFCIPREVCG